MSKKRYLWLFVEWAAYLIVVYWLVDGSMWLDFFLASTMVSISHIYGLVKENRQLFDISDSEVVRVSALAARLEEELADVTSKLEDAESRIAALELATE